MDLITVLSNVLAAATPLDQAITNGLNTLGTLTTPLLPPFLTNNPITEGFPWGEHNCTNTNPYMSAPDTGVVRAYDFTISRGILSPDGYEKEVILINDQFPGPTIEANWGDTIEVTVTNNITTDPEGTTIHWHGFLQQESQWMDGAPGFSQCPIPPEKSFTYRFHASLFGTTWYHAHYSAQYTDGAVGAMVVYGPTQEDIDIDIGPILLSDWFHTDYYSIVKTVMSPSPLPPRPMSDNNLIQGKMSFNCSTATDKTAKCSEDAGVARFRFQSGKRHRLRLINAGADATQQFSIDNHTMTVIANDFVPVEPYDTAVVTLAVGQRTDVIVEATGDPKGAYWIRSNATCTNSNQPYALAALYYDDADLKALPESSPWQYQNVGCDNDPLGQTVPLYSIDPNEPAKTMTLDMTAGKNASGIWLWYINNSSFRTDYNEPVLLLAKDGKTTYDDQPDWNVIDTGNSSSYRFVINNHTPKPHPMHLHGHNMYILDVGVGSWNGTVIRPTNPQRRDVQMVPSNGYLVVQADADNPGSWALHCHMVFHGSGGLAVDILERPATIKELEIPEESYQLCKDWQAFSATGEVDQIDSGLGRGFVSTYLNRPNSVVIAAVRNPSEECVKDLQSLPKAATSSLIVVKIDSSSETDAAAAIKQLQDEHKITSLDVVIANAGMANSMASVEAASPADLYQVFQVNVVGPTVLFSAVAPLLRECTNKPKFVTISSVMGTIGSMEKYPVPGCNYGMSKAALNFITKKIHVENEHLIAFPVHPGWVQTDMGNAGARLIGVEKAPTTIDESISALTKLIDESTRDSYSGKFMSYDGTTIAW